MAPGDLLLLCSDGLTTMVADDEIARILREAAGDVAKAARRWSTRPTSSGGEDNITVVLLKFEE